MKAIFTELTVDPVYQEQLDLQDLMNAGLEPDLPESEWVKGVNQTPYPFFAFDEDVPF
jgi:hypothetical protein